ncbi:DUF6651 domain-containing protein [Delftia tsuruhatensis]|uniref:DUF6651 domain-containing protein n=1 Tax=Delftia tsuruhatensis TaxID=180282 RepID=UPI002448D4DA|nr:DUF6651 domain-containing protein [Delftia tsuruhatensis]MDH1824618.1 hypothetical protein [Delftia tsuruhatensis]
MPFKYDANGAIVLQEVNGQKLPVFVHPDGKEVAFDGDSTLSTISRLNGEARGHRERAEAAESALKPFKDAGIEDPAAAAKALSTVKNLDDKKLVDAGEVEKVKAEAIKSVRAEFDPVVQERDSLKNELYAEKIGGAFARSEFISKKVAMPADFVQAAFGKNFSIEGGKVVAKDANGQPMFSRTRHGEPANFEEALEMLIDTHPHKDSILKGSGASGSGAGGGGGAGGQKTMGRAQFEQLDPAGRAAAIKGGTTVTD